MGGQIDRQVGRQIGHMLDRRKGSLIYAYAHILSAQVVTVSDDEMREATRALYRAGVVAEVSGAAAVAAVLAGKLGDVSGMHLCGK